MEQKGELISYRPDIKVVDCTIRDGGLVNNFYFDDEFVRNLYTANVAAGVEYMEFGYKASKEIFDVKEFGKWKFMIRIATYINTIPAAIEMIHYCAEMGYETTINIMAVSTAAESELDLALDLLAQSEVGTIYLVDSYGSLYPEQIRRLADKYLKVAEKYGKKVGIHAHNNQQLAFANTIEACTVGVSYLDATMSGMGRGAGNCNMELLLGFLRNPKYSLNPVLKFLQNQMLPLKKTGLVWGCDVQYMLTGQQNQHPRTAIAFTAEKREDYAAFYQSLLDRE